MTEIEKGDLVWIVAGPVPTSTEKSIRGVVMGELDGGWYRVYSSYWTSAGERTNIQDFPAAMLRCVYEKG